MTTPDPGHPEAAPTEVPLRLDDPTPSRAGRRNPRRLAAAGVVAVVALGAGVFGITAMSDDGGHETPEAAVEAFFDAVDDEDVIGLLEAVDPAERAALRRAIDGTIQETDRAAITERVDLDDVPGVELAVTGLTHTTQHLTDDLAAVDLTGGAIEGSASLATVPFGRTVRDVLGAELDQDTDIATGELSGIRVMTIERGGGWYVSATYTAAEAIRLEDQPDSPLPNFGAGTPATGADSPEAVVRDLVTAIDEVDVAAMIGLTSPTRARVLHDYGPMLIDIADDTDPDEVSLTDVELTTADGPDGTTLVKVTAYELALGGEYETVTHRLADGCLITSYEYPDTDEYPSPEDPWFPDEMNSCAPDGRAMPGAMWLAGPLGVDGESITFVTVEEDGRWFLDPLDSVGSVLVTSLRSQSVDELRSIAYLWTGASWMIQDDDFWTACGVERPAPSVGLEAGYDALDRCISQLPIDYEGGWYSGYGFGFSGSGGEDTVDDGFSTGTTIVCAPGMDEACGDFDPLSECFDLVESEAIDSCVRDGVDSGEIEPIDGCFALPEPDEIHDCLSSAVDAGTVPAEVLAAHACDVEFGVDRELTTDEEQAYAACIDEAFSGG
jgi:hypothetical protein